MYSSYYLLEIDNTSKKAMYAFYLTTFIGRLISASCSVDKTSNLTGLISQLISALCSLNQNSYFTILVRLLISTYFLHRFIIKTHPIYPELESHPRQIHIYNSLNISTIQNFVVIESINNQETKASLH